MIIYCKNKEAKERKYKELKLADYLSPCLTRITITDQRNIFAIRNRMVPLQSNFGNNNNNIETCLCGYTETMEHIYYCKYWNQELNINIPFEEIFQDNVPKQIEISRRFFQNFEKRNKVKTETNINIERKQNEPHVIQFCDPLFLLNRDSNGL